MFDQIKNVIKTAEPKHLLKALVSPAHTIKAIKYHYRRVPEHVFIRFLAREWGCSDKSINNAYKDLDRNASLWEEVRQKLTFYPNSRGLQMTRELPSLYLILRLMKPKFVFETGVASGASSAYILCALHDNKYGTLYSIDLPPDNLPDGEMSGFVVPQLLRERWRLHVGNSKNLLESLLEEVGEIDCFIHDSLHTYEHMMWEFRTAWEYLRPCGLLLSHDVGANEAFFDFMKEKGISWKCYRVYHVLGGFQKV